MTQVRKKISFKGEEIFVGIDVHKTQWTIGVVTQHTNYRPFTMTPSSEKLINYLHCTYPDGVYNCAYEAGFSGYGLYQDLWEAQIKCIVVHAADIPVSHKESEYKTDQRDALKIAKCLRSGQLVGISIPDPQLQQDRSLVRFRQQLRKDKIRQKCRLKSLLAFYSIKVPEKWNTARWSSPMRSWLWNLELSTKEGTKALHLHMAEAGLCIRNVYHYRQSP